MAVFPCYCFFLLISALIFRRQASGGLALDQKTDSSLSSVKMIIGIRSQQMRGENSANHRSAAAKPQQNGRWINPFPLAAGFVFLLALGLGPAAARPQDEVLSGAFRCAAIGELRTWLDCFYGAAQPERLSLGLPPAPAAQARLVAAPPAGTAPGQDMELRDDVLRSAMECNRTVTGRDWLTCFYAAAEPVRTRLGLASSASTATAHRAAAPASDFGLKPKAVKQPDSVAARMADYQFDRNHLFTVTLDNGQVWQQIAGDDRLADWDKPAATYTVMISHGVFGSYNFRVSKSGSLYKVRRIR
jgi:hypothetical protein